MHVHPACASTHTMNIASGIHARQTLRIQGGIDPRTARRRIGAMATSLAERSA